MLSLQTRSDWSAASVAIRVGAPPAETWNCPATCNSAVDAVTSLCDWANDAARAWFPAALFDWTWTRHAATGGATLTIRNSGGVFDFTPDAEALALLGIPAGAGVTKAIGTSAAEGTWAPAPGGYLPLRMGVAWLQGPGAASGVGAIRPGVPGLAPWAATCRPVVEVQDCARLTDILRLASHPRRGWLRLSNVLRSSEYVLPPDEDGWRLVALGAVQRSRNGVSLWQCDLALGGDAV